MQVDRSRSTFVSALAPIAICRRRRRRRRRPRRPRRRYPRPRRVRSIDCLKSLGTLTPFFIV
jgi:hypothetical protein